MAEQNDEAIVSNFNFNTHMGHYSISMSKQTSSKWLTDFEMFVGNFLSGSRL